MRLAKAFCTAGVAAICTLAFAGVGSASGETLCKAKPVENECLAGDRLGIPTTIKAQTGEISIVAGALTIKCVSTIKGATVENIGPSEGLKGKLTEATLVSCSNCAETGTAENLPYKFVMAALAPESGTVDFLQWEAVGIPRFKFANCFGSLTCIYGAASIGFKFKASAGATKAAFIEVGATAPVLQKQAGSSATCNGTAKIEKAIYEVQEPLPLWLAEAP